MDRLLHRWMGRFLAGCLIVHLPLLVLSSDQPNHHSGPSQPYKYPLHVLASFDPFNQVTLFQCYPNYPTEAERLPSSFEYDPSIDRRDECCRGVQRLAENEDGPLADDFRMTLSIQCDKGAAGTQGVGLIAEVPALEVSAGNVLLPSHVLLHAASRTLPTRRQPTAPANAEGDTDSDEALNETVWSHLVWDAWQNRVLFDRTDQLESVWEELSSFFTPPNPGGEPAHFHASLRSMLSDSGGMHRLLRVVITSHLPPGMKSTSGKTGLWELDMSSLFYLPSGVFVNVQDAFDHPHDARTNLRLQLITVEDAIIDEEQPEFSSPSHAVLVRIQATIDEAQFPLKCETQHSLSFGMKLHLRYPPSIATIGDSFSRLVIPSPYLLSGTLRRTTTGSEAYWWTPLQRDFVAGSQMAPQLHAAWVSAGKQFDAGFVMVVTLLVLLGGAMSMGSGISKIVVWD
jgi:hypothetical protein